jgi:predicted nucleic-acid-binding protein
MRGLDTNVLVRYLIGDDPDQQAAAEQCLAACERYGQTMFLSAPALCELVWVLGKVYGRSRAAIADDIDLLLRMPLFRIEHERLVARSVVLYRSGKADFADYLIREINRASGCRDTVTFDRQLKGASGFSLLG